MWERYSRQMILPDFGEKGQDRLKIASALLVGVGGLGSVISLYLTAAGIGRIGIIDKDTVSIHNLQRQILYTEDSVGLSKVIEAKQRLHALNKDVRVDIYNDVFTDINARHIVEQYDIVIDGTDNFQTRYLINDICFELGKPYIYAAVCEFEGQVSIFNYNTKTTYRDIYPDSENLENKELGILGTVVAVIGGVAATEAIKLITGVGDILDGKLWTIDIKTMQTNIFNLKLN